MMMLAAQGRPINRPLLGVLLEGQRGGKLARPTVSKKDACRCCCQVRAAAS